MKSKALILVVIALAVLGNVLGHYAVYWMVFRAPTVIDTSSPGATYHVILNGRADHPLFLDHTVRFTVLKHNQPLASQLYFHSGDGLDPNYSILYPQHEWVAENVLHFYRRQFFSEGGEPGSIFVNNKTNKVIKYLRVNASNAYLLFELQPGSTTKLTIPPPRGDHDYIHVQGQYLDGAAVESMGVSFIQDKTRPAVYFMDVTRQVVSIQSPRLRSTSTW